MNRTIHCVWLGGNEKPPLAYRCMNSWRYNMPDYKIQEWNETNFDINKYQYTKQAYEQKKYAFVSDVIRLWALYNFGGIYMDADVEAYNTLDYFLEEPAFTGFESVGYPVCATMGAEKGNPIIKEFLDYYENRDFEIKTNTVIMSEILEKHGIDRYKNEIQKIEGITIYPTGFFNDMHGYTKHWFERLVAKINMGDRQCTKNV